MATGPPWRTTWRIRPPWRVSQGVPDLPGPRPPDRAPDGLEGTDQEQAPDGLEGTDQEQAGDGLEGVPEGSGQDHLPVNVYARERLT